MAPPNKKPSIEELKYQLDGVQSKIRTGANNNSDMELRMMEMMGPKAEGSPFLMNPEHPIYHPGQYTPVLFDYGDTKFSDADIALINTAALCQPEAASHGVWGTRNPKDEVNVDLNFVAMYQNIMVTSELRQHSGAYIDKTYNTARELGHQAILAYQNQDKAPLGKLLGDSIRKHIEYNIGRTPFSPIRAAIVRNSQRMMDLLNRDPELKQYSGLTQDEMKHYEANCATERLYEDNLSALEKLYRHELGQAELTPEELSQNRAVVLLYQSIHNDINDRATDLQMNAPELKAMRTEFMQESLTFSRVKEQREQLQADLNRLNRQREALNREYDGLEKRIQDWNISEISKRTKNQSLDDAMDLSGEDIPDVKKSQTYKQQREVSMRLLEVSDAISGRMKRYQEVDANYQKAKNRTDKLNAQMDGFLTKVPVTDSQARLAEDYEGAKQELTKFILSHPKADDVLQQNLSTITNMDSFPWSKELEDAAGQMAPEHKSLSQEMAQVLNGISRLAADRNSIRNNLELILIEPHKYVRQSDGAAIQISGYKNDPLLGTKGTQEAFVGGEYKDHPLHEVSRDMPSHFKIYCLSKGMTEDELLSLRNKPSPELREKLLGWKDNFMQMVIDKNMDEISNMYVDVGRMLEADGSRFRNATPVSDLYQLDPGLIQKYAGSQSWIEQTIDTNTPNSMVLADLINQKLKERGKDYTFAQMQTPAASLDGIVQSRVADNELGKNRLEDMPSSASVHMLGTVHTVELMKALSKPIPKEGTWLSNIDPRMEIMERNTTFAVQHMASPLDYYHKMVDQAKSIKQTEISAKPFSPGFDEVNSLCTLLTNNVRKSLFGGKKNNSTEYQNVLDASKNITDIEKNLAERRKAGQKPTMEELKALQAAYKDMSDKAKIYLDTRPHPRTDEGKSRRALISQCFSFANQQQKEMQQELKASSGHITPTPEELGKKELDNLRRRIDEAPDGPCKQIMELAHDARTRMIQQLQKTGQPYENMHADMKAMVLEAFLTRNPQQAQRLNDSKDPHSLENFVLMDMGSQFNAQVNKVLQNEKVGFAKENTDVMRNFAYGDGCRQFADICCAQMVKNMDQAVPQKQAEMKKNALEAANTIKSNGKGM